jgi:hypothetical protein
LVSGESWDSGSEVPHFTCDSSLSVSHSPLLARCVCENGFLRLVTECSTHAQTIFNATPTGLCEAVQGLEGLQKPYLQRSQESTNANPSFRSLCSPLLCSSRARSHAGRERRRRCVLPLQLKGAFSLFNGSPRDVSIFSGGTDAGREPYHGRRLPLQLKSAPLLRTARAQRN